MLLIDTGIFVSVADRNEPRHLDCVELFRSRRDLTVSASVIVSPLARSHAKPR